MSKAFSRELNYQEKKKISFYSILVNTTLSIIKIVGGMISGSAALTADGVHSLSDLAASLSVYIGIIISNKKSKRFPFGLYKVENLIALVSAFAIFFAGYEIAKDVFFGEPVEMKNLVVALAVIATTVLITYFYAKYEEKQAEKLNSPILKADAAHIRADFYTALVVLAGILFKYYGIEWGEKLAVLVVLFFIFHSGYEILKDAIMVLLDAAIDDETINEVENILKQNPKVNRIIRVTGRNSGSFKFLQLDLDLKTDSLEEAHQLAHRIEDEIREQMPFVEKVVVHYE